MVFNWFRRKTTSEEDSTQSTETLDSGIESQSDTEPNAIESSTDQEDYLAWAKTAYQNLQQRQQPENLLNTPDSDIPNSDIPDSDIPNSDIPDSDIPDSDTPGSDTPIINNVVEAISIEAEVAPEIGPEVVPTEIEIAANPIPLEPESLTPLDSKPRSDSTTPLSLQDSPTLEEGFLWSAEVLAAQGRRPEEVTVDEINWLQKLRKGLDKTRRGMVNQIKTIVGKGPLTPDAIAEIEALLLQADVGVEATDTIIEALQQKMLKETLQPEAAIAYLKTILQDILDAPFQSQYSPVFAPTKNTLNLWLMTGVNGAGKTTTIGKLAHIAKLSGYSCLIAAADTFRAAAVEQVKIWGQRSEVDVIANPGQNTDPAAVVFDAITAAQSRNIELLLVDTAGRLQNKKNLMDELRKVRQIIAKKAPDAQVESLLVLDATLGQNGLRQAQVFSEAAQLSGVVLTKLDGSGKGGVALAVVQQLGLPIRFIGAGEGIQDLRPFSSYEFVEALLSN